MLTQKEQDDLNMATICSECRWGVFLKEEHDGLVVRMETPLCAHMSSLIGRDFVTGEFKFKTCELINIEGNCPIFEPKTHKDQENVISHDGITFDDEEDKPSFDEEQD